ncbi:hypothetical protein N0B44_33895 [Roseibacterium beibuensis]|uniref:hypothetical protein n=1 Tax=[Roseibacterium] beibuensis TaxID=1193142 RepID=UPI00217ECD4A|nr:hypothetical protein [Roseibacterium beibuensis]MCS6627906.1 hypothetical protein [Roseibacterium beibuensis]
MGLRNAAGKIEIEVLYGAPGAGKSIALRDEALGIPGLYLFCLPTIPLIKEQAEAFRELRPGPHVKIIEARSGEGGGRSKVQRQLDEARADLAAHGTVHAIVFMTHESMMACDLSGFVDWHIRIDEVPNAVQTGKVTIGTAESRSFFRNSFTLDPVGDDWAHAKLNNAQANWKDRAGDALINRLGDFFKLAARPQGAFVNVHSWIGVKEFQWVSLWSPTLLEHAASLKIAAAAYLDSLGYKAVKEWWGNEIEEKPTKIGDPRSGWPTIRVHYFTEGHEGTSKFWGRSEGRKMIKAVCDYLGEHVSDIGFWSGNEEVRNLMEWRVGGVLTRPKVAGSNEYRDLRSCAFIYSSKPLPGDEALCGPLFRMSKADILAAREDEDIHQFVMRGIIRNEIYEKDYDCYVYSKRQAEALATKLEAIAKSVEMIAVEEAGILTETGEREKTDSGAKVPKPVVRVPGAKGKGDRLLKSKARQEQRAKAKLTK